MKHSLRTTGFCTIFLAIITYLLQSEGKDVPIRYLTGGETVHL